MGTRKKQATRAIVVIDGVEYEADVVRVLPVRRRATKKRATKKAAPKRARATSNPAKRPPLAPPGTPRSQWYYWTESWQAAEREALEDFRAGRVSDYSSGTELLRALRRGRG